MPAPLDPEFQDGRSDVVDSLRSELRRLLDMLDQLDFTHAGAHLSMAIDCLDRREASSVWERPRQPCDEVRTRADAA